MLCGAISALLFTSAAGAQVHAVISANGAPSDLSTVDGDVIHQLAAELPAEGSSLFDVSQPETEVIPGYCEYEKISCKLPDVVLLKPLLHVIAVRQEAQEKGLALHVGDLLVGMKTKETGKGIEPFDEEKLHKLKPGQPIIIKSVPKDPTKEAIDFSGQEDTVVLYKEESKQTVPDFLAFWQGLVHSGIAWAPEVIDQILYDRLAPYSDNESFFRNIAKSKMEDTDDKKGEIVLEFLLDDLQKKKFSLPKVMGLLTKPELYKSKGTTHRTKLVAEEYRKHAMAQEFEEERERKAVEIRKWLEEQSRQLQSTPIEMQPKFQIGAEMHADI